jgi:GNAT superfamily N-acetyltransferase
LIGSIDNQPVGYALFFTTFSTFLGKPGIWLEDLFVMPEHRGCGVGKALLRAVANLAVERGCGRLEWSVLDWNQPAIDFYQRAGATILSDWRICRVNDSALSKLGTRDV